MLVYIDENVSCLDTQKGVWKPISEHLLHDLLKSTEPLLKNPDYTLMPHYGFFFFKFIEASSGNIIFYLSTF